LAFDLEKKKKKIHQLKKNKKTFIFFQKTTNYQNFGGETLTICIAKI